MARHLLLLLFTGATATTVSIREPPSSRPSTQDALSADDILLRMARAYATCRSYRDSGIVRTTFIGRGRPRIEEKRFKTAFVRPDRFRFEYAQPARSGTQSRCVIWARGQRVRTWSTLRPRIRTDASLGAALAEATGISSGSAHTVPALLLPGVLGGRPLTDLLNAERLADCQMDGAECYRITGSFANSPMTVWIDRATFALRRIDERTKQLGFRTEETTTYDPAFDTNIAPDDLGFHESERL